jgi:protein N-terminal methyltransferase
MASFTQPPSESASTLSVSLINDLLTATLGKFTGMDTEDREYKSLEALWGYELDNKKKKSNLASNDTAMDTDDTSNESNWYKDAFNYWEDEEICPITDDGVLGGYGALTEMDTRDSNIFLDTLKQKRPELAFDLVADCGAGIGRVTKNLLLSRFNHVHLVEQSPRLMAAAPEYLGKESNGKITCIVEGLQDFNPAPNTYDVIWIQWVIGHLHDLDFIHFFRRCAIGLKPGGIIALKDNTTSNCAFLVDKEDSSIARHLEYIRILIRLAGLNIVMEQVQKDFPEELLPVTMFAIAPP